MSASRLLKTGGVLIYSTCSFAPEENEAVIDWLLKKTGPSMKTEKIVFSQVPSYAPLLEWGKRIFQPQVLNCFRVLPDEMMEGFFIAKLIKII